MDSRQSQPQPQHRAQRTPDEPPIPDLEALSGSFRTTTNPRAVGMMQGEQRMVRECYLISIRLLWIVEQGSVGSLLSDKKPRTRPPPPTAEALVIHMMTLAEPERPRTEAADGVEQVPLDMERPDRTASGSSSWSLPSVALASSLSSLRVVALPSRGIVSSLPRPSSSVVGGLNSTNLGPDPQPGPIGGPPHT
ncbi:LOW QUALITY PROTEIN: hypothetical protein Cgig2_025389 [Carnegiea gigantea]|uniref:Uncharacterized protein n=1 Tax=Carnegiea gigantea TaxID=171969 RepID=A0A9Q1JMP9_9CARY|nr:LOW QUALITY PROTEIN: hypothetical protein Cgig2_025389 [Carnegiea gigantea]